MRSTEPQIVVNGNTALALGVLASGMDICAMYPITPATSASHYLSDVFEKVGGIVHQAEDEIAACAFAIGASYAGKCAVTITSGPGYSLKQEAIGLAVMAEIPLVVVNVQRGGPTTGQPTKVEQGDLLTAIFGSHGDAPKVVMAPSGIEDCFYSMITARKIAETFNMVVVVLSDASLATAQQPFPRPQFDEDWLAPPVDQTPVPDGRQALRLGSGHRPRAPLHARPAGRHAHADRPRARPRQPGRLRPGDQRGGAARPQPQARRAAEDAEDAAGVRRRRRRPAGRRLGQHQGRDRGGGRRGCAPRASRCRRCTCTSCSRCRPGISEILKRFKHVMTIEGNWSDQLEDELIDEDNRRYSALAMMLRSRFLVDVDCWSEARGQPIKPGEAVRVMRAKLAEPLV